ncbi:MAG: hypothetical protein KDC34_15635 [Saprospiraceae bacterium]|nr:hypothetical protein [Saprospiraceae bacterium]
MKQIAFYTLLLFSGLSLTGCFEILEEVQLASDGTGDLKVTVNLSQSKSTLANYLKMGEYEGYEIPSVAELEKEIIRVRDVLRSVNGMSQVEVKSNFTDFIFEIKGRFSNVQVLNVAINEVAKALNPSPFDPLELDNFDYTGKSFRRYFNYPLSLLDFDDIPSIYQYMLDTGKMTSIYRFDRDIRACTNTNAQISPNKQSVMLETTIGAMIRGERTIANSVILYPKP